jgi:thiamine-monophosphate kinase
MVDSDANERRPPEHRPLKGERAFLHALARELPKFESAHGFGDDLAPLEFHPGGLLWTTDMLMDGVDFLSDRHSWRQIGHKAMAVNLSDCAASATTPVSALCAVALNNRMSMDDALELFRGMRDCGVAYQCPITGGDTNSWDSPTVIAVTVAARPDPGYPPVTRAGAKPGDRIYLSGPVGGSILGRHLAPVPRIQAALDINRNLSPHAMIDISDGLVVDLWHLCEASGCGAVLKMEYLLGVVHPDAATLAKKTGQNALEHAFYDGEDFELIVAIPPRFTPEQCRLYGLTLIGEFRPESAIVLHEADRPPRTLEIRGWEHFRDDTR